MAKPQESIMLIIRTRQNILYEGEVRAVSSTNETGPFDVLPEHAYFICVIKKGVTIHHLDRSTQQIPITEGVMHVEEGKVHVYLDYDTPS